MSRTKIAPTPSSRSAEARLAFIEGQIGALLGDIMAAEIAAKRDRAKLKVLRGLWTRARREWLASRRASPGGAEGGGRP